MDKVNQLIGPGIGDMHRTEDGIIEIEDWTSSETPHIHVKMYDEDGHSYWFFTMGYDAIKKRGVYIAQEVMPNALET
jgi:hypothetical protein